MRKRNLSVLYYSSGSFFHGLSAQEPARKRAAVGAPFRFAFLFASDSSWWQHRTGVVGKGLKTFARDQKSIFVSTSRLTPRLFAINLISVFSKRIVAELCQIQRNRFGRAIPNVRYYPFLSECGGESRRPVATTNREAREAPQRVPAEGKNDSKIRVLIPFFLPDLDVL